MPERYCVLDPLGMIFASEPLHPTQQEIDERSRLGHLVSHAIIPTPPGISLPTIARAIDHIYNRRGLDLQLCDLSSSPHNGKLVYRTPCEKGTVQLRLRGTPRGLSVKTRVVPYRRTPSGIYLAGPQQ